MTSHEILINRIAKEQRISPREVNKIISAHTNFLKTSIEEEIPSVRVPYLGTIKLNKTALNKYKEKYESDKS